MVQVGEKIGSGSSGSTYRATFHGATVCAKKLNVRTSNEARCFLRELTVSGLPLDLLSCLLHAVSVEH